MTPSPAIAATMSGLIGKFLGRNYQVVEPLDAGAMGMVFVVEHVNLPKRFAAKVLTPDLARHPEAIARFEAEARAVSQLEHENIVSVVDYGKTDDGCIFIIMELLRGKTLQARIDQGPVSLEEIVGIMIQVCRALSAAHAAGIVHRDMKPDNVFLVQRPSGQPLVKVLDFGVSKAREGSLRGGRITRQGQVLGSPEYMSPEASRGDEVDARADVYAVGIILYQLLCGDVPFRHENYLKVLQMHVSQAPLPPRALAPGLPDELEELILRALEKDPTLRQASIDELQLDLIAALPDLAHRVMSASHVPTHPRWSRSSSHPPIAGEIDSSVAQRSVSPPAAWAPTNNDTIDMRRGRSRALVLGLWGGALGVAAAIGIALWLQRRDVSPEPTPAQETSAAVHTLSPPETAAGSAPAAPAETPAAPAETPAAPAVAPVVPGETGTAPAPAGDVQLRVDSSPQGATVTLDGRRLGRTPIDARVPLSAREGKLELHLRGHRTARRSVPLDRDGELSLSLERDVRRRSSGGRPELRSRAGDEDRPETPDALRIKERR